MQDREMFIESLILGIMGFIALVINRYSAMFSLIVVVIVAFGLPFLGMRFRTIAGITTLWISIFWARLLYLILKAITLDVSGDMAAMPIMIVSVLAFIISMILHMQYFCIKKEDFIGWILGGIGGVVGIVTGIFSKTHSINNEQSEEFIEYSYDYTQQSSSEPYHDNNQLVEKVKFCPRCGRLIKSDSGICTNCNK